MRFLDWLFSEVFGCLHTRTTFPQGNIKALHVTCLECGKELAYDWEEMRVVTDGNQ